MVSQKIQRATIANLSVAHMINDMYNNFLPQLLPIIVVVAGLSLAQASALVSVFSISSSLLQPIFGYLVDQKGQRWLVSVGTVWMAVLLGLTGLVTNYWLLFLMAAFAGVGTAAFHPQASSMVSAAAGKNKAVIMSMFIAMGNLGWAIAPLILLPLFNNFGAKSTPIMIIPGIIAAIMLHWYMKQGSEQKKQNSAGELKLESLRQSLSPAMGELSKIIVVVALRSLAYMGLITMLPHYFKQQHISSGAAAYLIFLMLAAGAVGGVIGGFISDRYGRKPLIISSLALATPLFFGFYYTTGLVSDIFLALAGASLLSSFSVTVVAAQEVIPSNKAFASGLTLGFAIGIGGLAVTGVGYIADNWGLSTAVQLLFAIPLLGGIMGFLLKGQRGTQQTA